MIRISKYFRSNNKCRTSGGAKLYLQMLNAEKNPRARTLFENSAIKNPNSISIDVCPVPMQFLNGVDAIKIAAIIRIFFGVTQDILFLKIRNIAKVNIRLKMIHRDLAI